MYRKTPDNQLAFEDFYLPFGGKLRSNNRWVLLARMVPWKTVEAFYEKQFSESGQGPPAKSARVALGALIIKERLGISDEEAVEQIRENPYLQYFLGFHEFRDEAPFDPSMFVHFRQRFSLEQLNRINEEIIQAERSEEKKKETSSPPDDEDSDNNTPPTDGNKGKLVVDATCTPADIRYPTDISLVNEAREKSERIIDILFEPLKGQAKKPRTYRQKARRLFLKYSKSRKPSAGKIRKALGQQLRFLKRNLTIIERLVDRSSPLPGSVPVNTATCWLFKSFTASSSGCTTSAVTASVTASSASASPMFVPSFAARFPLPPNSGPNSRPAWSTAWLFWTVWTGTTSTSLRI